MSYKLKSAEQFYTDTLSPDKGTGYFHEISFDKMALPEIEYWQVGEEYLLIIKVKEVEHKVEKEGAIVKEKAKFKIMEVGEYKEDFDYSRAIIKEKIEINS